MLNKFFKTIHNKYSRLFKFIFFLRYLFATFFVSIFLFLIVPIFLNHEKKAELIKNYLKENYYFEINEYKNIKYKAFPVPRLEFKKTQIKFLKSNANFNVNYLKIYPKIFSIYNLNHFEVNKIIFKENDVNLKTSKFFTFIEQLSKQRKKISFNGLTLKIVKDNKLVIKLENIFFSNFGYKKNSIEGKIFGKKFEAKLKDNLEFVEFKLLNSGITTNLELNKKTKTGNLRSKILSTNLKFDFEYDNQKLKIFDSYFRSKNLSYDNETLITLSPFFEIETNFELEEFNHEMLKKINFVKLLEMKNIIKKINSKNTIIYKPKKFSKSFINDLNLKVDLANGRLNYEKDFLIEKNFFKCKGDLNLLEEYPLLYFDCSANIKDKKRLLKKFLINIKSSDEVTGLKVKGNLNFLNKKINFEQISLNEKKLPKEDLNYFKISFENILFNKRFLEIFEIKKIKNFILEVI
jgi:hypothetical protein